MSEVEEHIERWEDAFGSIPDDATHIYKFVNTCQSVGIKHIEKIEGDIVYEWRGRKHGWDVYGRLSENFIEMSDRLPLPKPALRVVMTEKTKEQRQRISMLIAYLALEKPKKKFNLRGLINNVLHLECRFEDEMISKGLGIKRLEDGWAPENILIDRLSYDKFPAHQLLDVLRWELGR